MTQWEYRIEQHTISDRWSAKKQEEEVETFRALLNQIGAEGWEMVGYESVPVTGAWSSNVKSYAYLLFFKRPA